MGRPLPRSGSEKDREIVDSIETGRSWHVMLISFFLSFLVSFRDVASKEKWGRYSTDSTWVGCRGA